MEWDRGHILALDETFALELQMSSQIKLIKEIGIRLREEPHTKVGNHVLGQSKQGSQT